MIENPSQESVHKELILETLNSLDKDKVEQVAAQLLQYNSPPPSVQEVFESDYFLKHLGDSLYPFWKERIYEMYPSRINTKSTIVIPRGALGIGKSTFGMALLAMDIIKWAWHPNPYRYLNLDKSISPTFIRFFNIDKNKAWNVLLSPFAGILDRCPYLLERRRDTGEHYPHNLKLGVAKRPNDIISEVLLGTIFSEVNFFRDDLAHDIISTILGRMQSRMRKALGVFSHVIIDSSDTNEESPVDKFIREGGWNHDLTIYTASIWQAKSHTGQFFNNGSFKVYTGHTGRLPFIIPDDFDIESSDLDKDRILIVPNELLPSYKLDIVKALQESAGISVSVGNRFFLDQDRLTSSFSIPQELDDEMIFDFYDDESIWDRIGHKVLELLPEERKIYGRLDLGIKQDRAGIALGYGDHASMDDGKFLGYYKFPIVTSLSRYPGQETYIRKITDFFLELSKHREIGLISTDQYQSTQLRQDLQHEGVPTKLISVDRTSDPYLVTKNLIMSKQVQFADNGIMKKEALELINVGQKIDHPKTGCFVGDTPLFCLYGTKKIKRTFNQFIELYNKDNWYICGKSLKTGKYLRCSVKNVFITKEVTTLVELVFNNSDQIYRCTLDHPFLTQDGYVWASNLKLHHRFVSNGVSTKLVEKRIINVDPTPVYDMTVPDTDNFLLWNGIVVHNSKDICDAAFGALYSIYCDKETAFNQVEEKKLEEYSSMIKSLARKNTTRFSNRGYY